MYCGFELTNDVEGIGDRIGGGDDAFRSFVAVRFVHEYAIATENQ